MTDNQRTVGGNVAADPWVSLAQAAMSQSTTFLDANYRRQLEKNLANFQSRHPAGSKYLTDNYKFRSKLFRPKTKTGVRKNEAAADSAFFSNEDVTNITAENDADPRQNASADVMKALLQYRLTKTIPWYQLVIGGTQDAQVQGVVCSYQCWLYEEDETPIRSPMVNHDTGEAMLHPETGEPQYSTTYDTNVVTDRPHMELVPLENVRFHPAAEWTDPVNSSPYVVRLFPMFVVDVKARMHKIDRKTGAPKWRLADEQVILAANSNKYDSTRLARDPRRLDAKGNAVPGAVNDYQVVWVEEHIHRVNGKDMIWYMLGASHRLTDPQPLGKVYLHGRRPLVMGTMVIETHKPIPQGHVEMGQDLQEQANEIANQRLDNVKFVLNKRWIAKRNGRVDIRGLVRNVPGGVTLADDPVADVREVNFPDVTGSAYMEQDRINVDHDDLLGNFSQSSVQTNRNLNETVGGMSMMLSGASQMTEYGLKVLATTWIEPVLRQLVALEQAYETDETILALAGQNAQLFQKYGIDQVTDDLLQNELTVRVNVGMGATNPQFRLQRFLGSLTAWQQFSAQPPPGANVAEIGKEIFALNGYKDGARFGVGGDQQQDPKLQQAEAMIAQLKQALEQQQAEAQAKQQGETQREQIRQDGEDRRTLMKVQKEKEAKIEAAAIAHRTELVKTATSAAQQEKDRVANTVVGLHANAQKENANKLLTIIESQKREIEQLQQQLANASTPQGEAAA